MRDLDQIIADARSELRDYLLENPRARYPEEHISEIADSSVPIHYGDILQCAVDDINLALNEPEVGPAFDGSPTPINIIAGNIYDRVTQELYDELSDFKDELADATDCAQCGEPVFENDEQANCEDCGEPMHAKCLVGERKVCDDCQEAREEAEIDAKETDDSK